jgi:DNA helicase IV
MAEVSPQSDPELQLEQDYLDRAHVELAAMRRRAEELLNDLKVAGSLDLDYRAAMNHRIAVLAESVRPLMFGRIDEEAGASWHIGRRHVEDADGDPVVVDWRAPVSTPFYQARVEASLGLSRRRQVMIDRQRVVAVADDLFGQGNDDTTSTRLRGGDALLAELERTRTGEMLDIVATIQAEQDDIIRAPLNLLVAVQGGPGTGKTAVGLHRAAFLLYNHQSLSQSGVLVLGPSRAFLRYIAQVLPSLGEEAVMQTTLVDLAPKVKVRTEDDLAVRRIKGDARMAIVLRNAVSSRCGAAKEEVTLRARSARCTLSAKAVNELVGEVARSDTPYKAGRLVLRARLVSAARRQLREAGRIDADQDWYERELVASESFKGLLDYLWPSISPTALVSDVLTRAELLSQCSAGVLTDAECKLLLRSKGNGLKRQAWAADDLALIDEADSLIVGRARTYGHIVVDEAQDLSPMQFRMLARRAPGGSLTILGDLAQATSAWHYESWDEILQHLPTKAEVRRYELTLGYRAPGQVLDLASRLLPEAAPSVRPTRSIRRGRHEPRILQVGEGELLSAAVAEAERLALHGFMVGLILPLNGMAAMTKSIKDRTDIGLLDLDGMDRAITIVPAPAAKGLEFDAAVVVEPSEIAGTDIRGLRLLYVALTRPIQHLSIVHAAPLPTALTEASV